MENVDQFVEYCNGIPGLLTCCTKSNYKKVIELKERVEFHTVVEYLIEHNKLVNWSLEMKILAAANLQIPVKNMGFDIEGIKQSYMLISHLIYIDDEGLPISYFPGTGQCLVTNIRLIFGNLKTMNMQTDHNSVLGHIFESKVLILMTETKELKLTILPLFGDQTNQDSATFKVQPYSCLRLESVDLSELQDDFFYRSPMNFEGVDFILTASQSGCKTLIARQVTLQAKNLKEKMAKRISCFV